MSGGERAASGWQVERRHGPAGDLHALEWPAPLVPTVWMLEVEHPALVLGSTQAQLGVDVATLAAQGIEVTGRRSGGGAVLLVPGQSVWIDVLVPVGHERWDEDVNRSFHWVGEAWAAALARLGLEAEVHRRGLVRTAASARVCFAGLGPGEVSIGGRKAVGLSQRRTRAGARFQTIVHQVWDPRPLGAIEGVDPAALPPVVVVDRPRGAIESALLAALG